MLIIHHNDLDGRCAAAIVYWYNVVIKPKIRFAEIQYGMPIPHIEPNEEIYILDFSFKPDDMKKITDITKNITWCDHHKTAAEYGYNFPGYCDFTEKGLSGCECTWKHVHGIESSIPIGVRLIGSYDSWRFDKDILMPNGSCSNEEKIKSFHEGCKIILPDSPAKALWNHLVGGFHIVLHSIETAGEYAIQYRNNYLQSQRKYAHEVILDGHKCLAMNTQGFGSASFGELFDKYDACIAYIFNGKKHMVSVYSTKIDCGALCKKFGGGGHKGAAGFTCNNLESIVTFT